MFNEWVNCTSLQTNAYKEQASVNTVKQRLVKVYSCDKADGESFGTHSSTFLSLSTLIILNLSKYAKRIWKDLFCIPFPHLKFWATLQLYVTATVFYSLQMQIFKQMDLLILHKVCLHVFLLMSIFVPIYQEKCDNAVWYTYEKGFT